jgi:hypothetical protein
VVKVHCDEGVATHEHLTLAEVVEIFLVSGPPEERQVYAGDIHKNQDCRIVLCSIYHSEQVRTTLDYVVEGGFDMFVQWLTPGRSDGFESRVASCRPDTTVICASPSSAASRQTLATPLLR